MWITHCCFSLNQLLLKKLKAIWCPRTFEATDSNTAAPSCFLMPESLRRVNSRYLKINQNVEFSPKFALKNLLGKQPWLGGATECLQQNTFLWRRGRCEVGLVSVVPFDITLFTYCCAVHYFLNIWRNSAGKIETCHQPRVLKLRTVW